MKFASDAMKSLSKMIAKILNSILLLIQALTGKRSTGLANAINRVTTDDIVEDYKDVLSECEKMHKLEPSDVAKIVHEYCKASNIVERSRVDVSALSVAQRDWLFSLSNDNLRRLANKGEYACENAINGKRCYIVGLPLFKEQEETSDVKVRKKREKKAEYRPNFAL